MFAGLTPVMDCAHGTTETIGVDCTYRYNEKTDCIGRGAHGAVYEAVVITKGNYTGEETVAVKHIHMRHGDTKLYPKPDENNKLREKWKLLVQLEHKNVVPHYKITWSLNLHGCLTLELMMKYVRGGDLSDLISRCTEQPTLLTQKIAVNLAWQIADGLAYLHQKGIIHGDLKPENVLVEPSYLLQIADVDNCVQLQRSVTCSKDVAHMIGTCRYMSPEMVKKFLETDSAQLIPFGRKTDLWSIGCVLHDLFDCLSNVEGRWLCKNNNNVEVMMTTGQPALLMKIATGFVPYISADIPEKLSNILRRCLRVDVTRRISAASLLESLRELCPVEVPETECTVNGEPKPQQHNDMKPSSVPAVDTGSASPPTDFAEMVTLSQEQLDLTIQRLMQFELPSEEDFRHITPMIVSGSTADDRASRFQHLAEITVLTVQLILRSVRSLPGFDTLSRDDQIELLKACSCELMMLRCSRRYNAGTDSIIFANNIPFSRENYKNACLCNGDGLYNFCKSMCARGLDNAEYALLEAIVVFSERPVLKETSKVESIKEMYMSALGGYLDKHHPNQGGLIFAQLLRRLTELRTLSHEWSKLFYNLRLQNRRLPPLLSNIWDLEP